MPGSTLACAACDAPALPEYIFLCKRHWELMPDYWQADIYNARSNCQWMAEDRLKESAVRAIWVYEHCHAWRDGSCIWGGCPRRRLSGSVRPTPEHECSLPVDTEKPEWMTL